LLTPSSGGAGAVVIQIKERTDFQQTAKMAVFLLYLLKTGNNHATY
jgi:hypothetical protein